MLFSFASIYSFFLELLKLVSMVRRDEEVVGMGRCLGLKTWSFMWQLGRLQFLVSKLLQHQSMCWWHVSLWVFLYWSIYQGSRGVPILIECPISNNKVSKITKMQIWTSRSHCIQRIITKIWMGHIFLESHGGGKEYRILSFTSYEYHTNLNFVALLYSNQ